MKSLLITLCILVVLATAVNAGRKPAPQPCTEQTDCPCPLFCTPGRQGQSTCQRKKNADLYVLNVSTYNGIGEIPLRTPTYPYPVSATVSAWGYPTDQVSWGYPVRTIQLYCGTLTTHVFTKDPDVDDANLPFNPTEIVYTLAPGGVFGDAETDNLIFLAPKRGRNSNARIVDWYGLLFNSPDGLSIANLFYQSKNDPGNVPGWVGPYELQYDGYQLQFQLSSFSDTTIQGNGATVSLSFSNNDDDDDDDDDQHSDKASYMDSASSSLLASTLMAALLILAIFF